MATNYIVTRQTTAAGVTNNSAALTNTQIDNNFVTLFANKFEADKVVSTNTVSTAVLRDANGSFAANIITCTDLNSTSDARLKENVLTLENSLEMVKNLRGVSFTFKNNPEEPRVGLIAQEVEQVLPQVIGKNYDGFKTVSYATLVAVLIEAVKELNGKVTELESLINK